MKPITQLLFEQREDTRNEIPISQMKNGEWYFLLLDPYYPQTYFLYHDREGEYLQFKKEIEFPMRLNDRDARIFNLKSSFAELSLKKIIGVYEINAKDKKLINFIMKRYEKYIEKYPLEYYSPYIEMITKNM